MRSFLFVVLAISCSIIAAAEDHWPLKPINRQAFPEEKRCSEFFFSTTFKGAVAEQIIFAYQDSDGNVKRDIVPKSRTFVQLSDDNLPTYEKITTENGSGALFRLPTVEYQKAHECLPEPKKQ